CGRGGGAGGGAASRCASRRRRLLGGGRGHPAAPGAPRGGAAIAASAGAGSGPRSAAVAGAGRGGAPVLTGQPRCSARTGGLGAWTAVRSQRRRDPPSVICPVEPDLAAA